MVTIFWLPIAPAPAAATPPPAQVLANVQAFYAKVQRVRARFEQEVRDPVFGRAEISTGRVWIAKPGKMRWDYANKKRSSQPKRSFVFDGKTYYMVDHLTKRVQSASAAQNVLPAAISFLQGKGDLAREFHVKLDASGTHGAAPDLVLALAPKRPSAQYKQLYLVVDTTDWHVKRSIVIDPADRVNAFSFLEPDTTTAMKQRFFVVNVPLLLRRGYSP